jgi:hypothetical protein
MAKETMMLLPPVTPPAGAVTEIVLFVSFELFVPTCWTLEIAPPAGEAGNESHSAALAARISSKERRFMLNIRIICF